jgi:hypothetical protein
MCSVQKIIIITKLNNNVMIVLIMIFKNVQNATFFIFAETVVMGNDFMLYFIICVRL